MDKTLDSHSWRQGSNPTKTRALALASSVIKLMGGWFCQAQQLFIRWATCLVFRVGTPMGSPSISPSNFLPGRVRESVPLLSRAAGRSSVGGRWRAGVVYLRATFSENRSRFPPSISFFLFRCRRRKLFEMWQFVLNGPADSEVNSSDRSSSAILETVHSLECFSGNGHFRADHPLIQAPSLLIVIHPIQKSSAPLSSYPLLSLAT